MKCRNCNNEMTLGYIQCRDGICWAEKPSKIASIPELGKNTVRLGKRTVGVFKGTEVEAYHCEKCEEILIKYGTK